MSIPPKDQLPRREFLIGCGQWGAAAFFAPSALPGVRGLLSPAAAAAAIQYHLHPHYREQPPLEALLAKRPAGLDEFLLEKEQDRIAVIMAEWSAGLRQSPWSTQAMEKTLAIDFEGPSLRPLESKLLRTGSTWEAHRLTFSPQPVLSVQDFSAELRHSLSVFSQLLTADFQVTRVDLASSGQLHTQVRYEMVGVGDGFHREQRVGNWDLTWQAAAGGPYRLRQWRQLDETRSRSAAPVFVDITKPAFAANPSYAAQLVHGVDYWRTILDRACGVDVYGHNGVSVGDVDGSGLDSLYVCQPAGLPNRLYRNRGDGTFEDITETSGVGVLDNTACALFADFDNDGRQDLLVVRADGPVLFLNSGGGKFREKPGAFQFATLPQGTFTGAAAADYDRNGWLDVYFCLYVYDQGTDQYKYPSPYYDANNGPPNFLMRNNRDGTFRDVTAEAGLHRNNTRYSFCCAWADFNNNGWPDLYVVNDFGRKNLYRNNGDGTFTDIAAEAGVEDVGAGMSVCTFDYNGDGVADLYVANMWTAAGERLSMQENFRKGSPATLRALYHKHAMGNSLLQNGGAASFQDKTDAAGVGLGRWAWSSDAWDFDHDGLPDLYVTNGMVSGPLREDLNSFFWRQVVAKSPDEAKPSSAYEQGWNAVNELLRSDYTWSGFERNVFYANNGDGSFSDISGAAGLDFLEDGRAFALADFDQDGRLELALKNRNGPQLRLLKNVLEDLPPSLCFRLRGSGKSNPDAIGAVVTLEAGGRRQTRTLQAGSGFLSQHSKEIFFGLGEAKGAIKATIRWPSGLLQPLSGLSPNQRVSVTEGVAAFHRESFRPAAHSVATPPPQISEPLPETCETWLIEPVAAPDFAFSAGNGNTGTLSALRGKPVLLGFSSAGVQVLALPAATPHASLPALQTPDDTGAIYNILYRWLFDRRRDLPLPTSFLLNGQGEIVKVYQGPLNADQAYRDSQRIPATVAERVTKALPFPADAGAFGFGRNYLSLGSIYFQRGYFEQAEAPFRRALRDDPSSAEVHYGLGSVYLKQSKQAEARASFEQAVKLNASNPDTKPNVWNHLGLMATQTGDFGQAADCFQQALRLNPDHLISLKNLGNAYREQQRWGEAQTTLEHAVSIDPDDPDAVYSLAMVYAQTNQLDRAYADLQQVLKLRPIYPEAMNNLGVLYLHTRRRDDAVAEFETCIRLAPDFDQSYLNLARVHAIEGHREQARATLLALLKQHPDHVQAERALEELK